MKKRFGETSEGGEKKLRRTGGDLQVLGGFAEKAVLFLADMEEKNVS